jgi:hypothetical protein
MTWSRTLQLSPKKFDKLTSTYGQILSDARQGLELDNYIFNSLCVIFDYGHFKPIPDELLSKIKYLGHF